MDGTKAGREKAVLPADRDADATPSSDAAAAAPADAPAAAGVDDRGAGSGGGEEEDDDEQVERFYALLANIRAMRGVYVAGGDTVGSGARKRLRGTEPPWTPAFRMEDFEEPSPTNEVARCAKRTQRQEADEEESGPRPAVAASSSPPRAGARSDSSSKSI